MHRDAWSMVAFLVLASALVTASALNADYYFSVTYPCNNYVPEVTTGSAHCRVQGICYPSLKTDTINAWAYALNCTFPIDIEALTSGNSLAIQGHAQTSGFFGFGIVTWSDEDCSCDYGCVSTGPEYWGCHYSGA